MTKTQKQRPTTRHDIISRCAPVAKQLGTFFGTHDVAMLLAENTNVNRV